MALITDLAWRIGGPQGSGVDTAARFFARSCAAAGLHVFGHREYYSNIMGRHSYYDVRVADHPLTCHRSQVDFMASFDAETLARHVMAVTDGGWLLHSARDADVPLRRLSMLDERAAGDLAALLDERGLPHSTAGLLEMAAERGVHALPVDFGSVTGALAKELGITQARADRTLNTVSVAVCCAALGLDRSFLVRALDRVFRGRKPIVELNTHAIDLAYRYAVDRFADRTFHLRLQPGSPDRPRIYVNGSEVVAMGKMAAGLAFQTYYPISPATAENTFLERHPRIASRAGGDQAVVVVQTEDEIAAITMAAGAALTGVRSSTATSGPGFSLMTEGLGWAGINEVPLVVTLWQRGGPSTGLPTRTEQGDLLSALYAGHGEFPRIVMASSDLTEAFTDAAQAFNYAERYQLPVIHLLDKALSSTTQTLPRFDPGTLAIDRGRIYRPDGRAPQQGSFPRFAVTDDGISPRPVLGQPGGMHWVTGGEHTEEGRVTEDPVVREQQMEKRDRKLEVAEEEIGLPEKVAVYGADDAALTVVSWGSTKGAMLEAIDALAGRGLAVRLVQVRLLWPFPGPELQALLAGAGARGPTVTVELNRSGQFARLLGQQTGLRPAHQIVKYNGRPLTAAELQGPLQRIAAGGAEPKTVIRNPWE